MRVDHDCAEPRPAVGWETIEVRAASLNSHGLFDLRGMNGIGLRLPTVLGSDGGGIDARGAEC